jgi:hypothetical protein
MNVICDWCNKYLRTIENENGDNGPSHEMCDSCRNKQIIIEERGLKMDKQVFVQLNQVLLTINSPEDEMRNQPVIQTIKDIIDEKREVEENDRRWRSYLKSIN